MTNKPTFSEVYDVNKKTGALILGKKRLDDYATKYLVKHCKKALETPMPLPVDEILAKDGLTVKEVMLSANHDIFGCCLLLDGYVEIYDVETGIRAPKFYKAGTVLIDPKSEAIYGKGSKRNTLIHEALHWEKDKRYFEILSVKNGGAVEELCPIMCRQSETFYEPPEGKKTKANEVHWLEWQAHRLAPRILMPTESFKRKALEIIKQMQEYGNDNMFPCDMLVEELSEFFIVSRVSVKIRLEEVGLLDKVSEFWDYEDVFAEINSRKEFIKLTPTEAYEMLLTDSALRGWVGDGHFIFSEGYFVLADGSYVKYKNGELRLTAKAKKNLAQCVISIHEQKYTTYRNVQKDLQGYSFLTRVDSIDQRMLVFHPKYQTNFKYKEEDIYAAVRDELNAYDEEEEIELIRLLGDPRSTLCQCLWFLMEKRKWLYPEEFNENTGLHKNYHGKIKNNKQNNMNTDTLMAICVGLKFNARIVEKIFDKSSNKLNWYQDPDKTYMRILEMFPGLSLAEFNSILKKCNIPELGSAIKGNE